METPSYIKALLIPNGRKAPGRKVWSIDLEQTWLPFFLATNTVGETRIDSEALGAPLRLAFNSDGSVKFSKMGRPVFRVVKDLSDAVKMVRENFTAGLASYAKTVYQAGPEGYKAEVQKAQEAGRPIMARDRQAIDEALTSAVERAIAEAEAKAQAQADKPKAQAKADKPKADKPKARPRKAKPQAQAPTEAPAEAQAPEPELVTA